MLVRELQGSTMCQELHLSEEVDYRLLSLASGLALIQWFCYCYTKGELCAPWSENSASKSAECTTNSDELWSLDSSVF
jgi:hypothetical protein